MPELQGGSGQQVINILQKMGLSWRWTKGSHAVPQRGSNVCVVPLYDELAVGTLWGVLRQAGVPPEEFLSCR